MWLHALGCACVLVVAHDCILASAGCVCVGMLRSVYVCVCRSVCACCCKGMCGQDSVRVWMFICCWGIYMRVRIVCVHMMRRWLYVSCICYAACVRHWVC